MRLLSNSGSDRVDDWLRLNETEPETLDMVSTGFSLHAWAALVANLKTALSCRLILTPDRTGTWNLLGTEGERPWRNRLQARYLATQFSLWLEKQQWRISEQSASQSLAVLSRSQTPYRALFGSCPLTLEGLGLTPTQNWGAVQLLEDAIHARSMQEWFTAQWDMLNAPTTRHSPLLATLKSIAELQAPSATYHAVLHFLLTHEGSGLSEDKVLRSGTGFKNSVVWNKLYPFQRDGVVGAIDKLERLGGCIIADSVGLGKTFEALAIIKYYELRNDRVLVLAPKRLRDNWTLYKANDKRNNLAQDRLHYDVLNHTDLSRDSGFSGDLDLSHINWGNYDLVVIDESHNFRNKITHQDRESRYGRLMRKIIRDGVKTRVLMLSATPVNNRLADLRNQIAFVTEGDDEALQTHGIASILETTKQAQVQFNKWLKSTQTERTTASLVDSLGFDYFKLLDLLTIARSRKHIAKYYGTRETGAFPERLRPINIKADVDSAGVFPAIRVLNEEIRRLHLGAYAPLRYILPSKQDAYDQKYRMLVRGGEGFFRQADREESLVHLLRINLLKRMESSVVSFALTVQRIVADIESIIERLDVGENEAWEELDITELDVDDPQFEPLLVGKKVKVLLPDVDAIRWKQDLLEDRNRLSHLLEQARSVKPRHDDKYNKLCDLIAHKVRNPLNAGNRKAIVFTAFADTASYLYEQLAPWAMETFGLHCALVTGSGHSRCTLPGNFRELGTLLSAFAPRAKERPAEWASEGEIDILIATDCISEGQNLQDCDMLVNYDIHWNPVRIIQRFGRIDRIGSPNSRIQLVNFWPNLELEEYIQLEARVTGRMVLLDVSATGEENVIEVSETQAMNDLEYRREQLLQLQENVLDLEDLSNGLAITDLSLNDFRMDLARMELAHPERMEAWQPGACAVVSAQTIGDVNIAPGVIFCLRAETDAARALLGKSHPLAPYALVQVGDAGEILYNHMQAKTILDALKRLCLGRDAVTGNWQKQLDQRTAAGQKMEHYETLLSRAIEAIQGRGSEQQLSALFKPGGTPTKRGDAIGIHDFEVLVFLCVLDVPV